MPYLWTTIEDVQRYLDDESTITVGANYEAADAIAMENAIVGKVKEFLGVVFTLPADNLIPLHLKEDVAMLTAARIGFARMGSSIGGEITNWTQRYKNEAWAHIQTIFITQTLTGATALSVPLFKRLLYAKTRERGVIPNV